MLTTPLPTKVIVSAAPHIEPIRKGLTELNPKAAPAAANPKVTGPGDATKATRAARKAPSWG